MDDDISIAEAIKFNVNAFILFAGGMVKRIDTHIVNNYEGHFTFKMLEL